jgi:ribosomal protein S27E
VPVAQQLPEPTDSKVIKFRCPGCRQKIGVNGDYAGKQFKCAACGQVLRIPALEQQPAPEQPLAAEVPGDQSTDKSIWNDQLLDFPETPHSCELPAQDALRVGPPPPPPVGRSAEPATCRSCHSPNSPDAEFCITCGEATTVLAKRRASAGAADFFLPFGASVGLTLAGVAAWIVLAYLASWSSLVWLHALAVGVGALAGYGMTRFTDERSTGMATLAVLVGLAGIIFAKIMVAHWIMMPKMQAFWDGDAKTDEIRVTDRQVDTILKNPDVTFMYASFYLSEQFGWDWEFTVKLTPFYIMNRGPRLRRIPKKGMAEEVEQLKEGVKKVTEAMAGWSEDEKRHAIRSGMAKQVRAFRAGLHTMLEASEDSNQPGLPPSEFAKETAEIVSGDRPLSESNVGKMYAFRNAWCCLDIIWIPLALFLAFKIASEWC